MKLRALAFAVLGALVVTPAALAGRALLVDTIPSRGSSSIPVLATKAPSFSVVLQVPATGRAQLFLTGKSAPRGGPLIDTRTYGCTRASGVRRCQASYERLPKGRYTWTVRWLGKEPARVSLVVRW